jgi:hypothetical protein
MKRLLITSLLAVTAFAVPGASARVSPSLQLVKRSPITVAGAHFFPRSSVKVTVTATQTTTLKTRANRTGNFQLTFPNLTFSRCGGGQIRALGVHGEVALVKVPQLACMEQ